MRNENADNERKKSSPQEEGQKKKWEYNRQCDSCDRTDRILRVGLSTV